MILIVDKFWIFKKKAFLMWRLFGFIKFDSKLFERQEPENLDNPRYARCKIVLTKDLHAVIRILPGSVFGGKQNSLKVSRILLRNSRSSFGLSNNGYRLGKTRFSKICRNDENIPFLTLSVSAG